MTNLAGWHLYLKENGLDRPKQQVREPLRLPNPIPQPSPAERELAALKASIAVAAQQQRWRALLRSRQALIDDLERSFNPPPREEEEYELPEEGVGRLGYNNFNPALMAQPMRWR